MSDINNTTPNASTSLLKFLTCGSVDDGKSTLIGRLLYESNLVYNDQIETLKKDSSKKGLTGNQLDFSLLLDGLRAEREQGITIDVAYRYFTTKRRKFIIADCPGHLQYTRNMVTGASHSDAAIILVDASKGLKSQTRRHAYIVSLLGIKNVIIAVNKMDLIGYDAHKFEAIKSEFLKLSKHLGFSDLRFIPLCAAADTENDGGNVVRKSDKMSFYTGKTLLETLEEINTEAPTNTNNFCFNVLYVNRPNSEFRGYSGAILSGEVTIGEDVVVLPSKLKTKIKSIVTYDGELQSAGTGTGKIVCVTLQDELDVSAGDLIVHTKKLPQHGSQFCAYVIWMNNDELKVGKKYVMRLGAKYVKAFVKAIVYVLDVDTMTINPNQTIENNSIAKVVIETTQDIFFDTFTENAPLGRFILIDTLTNATMCGGMIIQKTDDFSHPENVFQKFY